MNTSDTTTTASAQPKNVREDFGVMSESSTGRYWIVSRGVRLPAVYKTAAGAYDAIKQMKKS